MIGRGAYVLDLDLKAALAASHDERKGVRAPMARAGDDADLVRVHATNLDVAGNVVQAERARSTDHVADLGWIGKALVVGHLGILRSGRDRQLPAQGGGCLVGGQLVAREPLEDVAALI